MVCCRGDQVLTTSDGTALERLEVSPGMSHATPLLLGLANGHPVFGLDLDHLDGSAARSAAVLSGRLASLRDAGSTLSPADAGLAAYLVALTGWHRHHGHCANCGAATEVTDAGLARHCPRCGRTHFPRTDPVVIMLVEHDDRLLLGRRPDWPAGRFSLLAGFVSPGETPEEAVIREVLEESGIDATDPRYVVAQPWPFPASLMLGFTAQSPGGEPRCVDGELQDVRWFSRAEVQGASERDVDWSTASEQPDGLLLPTRVSIARSLIDWWLSSER